MMTMTYYRFILKDAIEKEFGKNCYAPQNGQSVDIPVHHDIMADISSTLLERQFFTSIDEGDLNNKPVHGLLVMHEDQRVNIYDPSEASSTLDLAMHTIKYKHKHDLTELSVLDLDELFSEFISQISRYCWCVCLTIAFYRRKLISLVCTTIMYITHSISY